MSIQWVPPKGYVSLTCTITYRCAVCGNDIPDGMHVLAPLDFDGRLIPETRAYHPDCTPREVTTNGS